MSTAQVCFTAPVTVEWGTPQFLFDQLNDEFGFTVDVAASAENAKCARYYTIQDDGLTQDWSGETAWMNPPYGREISSWMRKAYESGDRATVVCLVPARTDTRWWWDYATKGEIRFLRGRLRFTGGSKSNPRSHNAPFPVAVVIFGRPPCVKWWTP